MTQSFDEITERSLSYAKGGNICEDFVHLTQKWLGRMQVKEVFIEKVLESRFRMLMLQIYNYKISGFLEIHLKYTFLGLVSITGGVKHHSCLCTVVVRFTKYARMF